MFGLSDCPGRRGAKEGGSKSGIRLVGPSPTLPGGPAGRRRSREGLGAPASCRLGRWVCRWLVSGGCPLLGAFAQCLEDLFAGERAGEQESLRQTTAGGA